MTELRGSYLPNWEDVAAKVIDGELIIIRLSDGTYYSMDNVGARVWELLETGHSADGLARTLAASYGAPLEQVSADIEALLQELLTENLVVPTAVAGAPRVAALPPGQPAAYAKPQLNIYRDMGNLLALDPPTPGIDDLLFKEGSAG